MTRRSRFAIRALLGCLALMVVDISNTTLAAPSQAARLRTVIENTERAKFRLTITVGKQVRARVSFRPPDKEEAALYPNGEGSAEGVIKTITLGPVAYVSDAPGSDTFARIDYSPAAIGPLQGVGLLNALARNVDRVQSAQSRTFTMRVLRSSPLLEPGAATAKIRDGKLTRLTIDTKRQRLVFEWRYSAVPSIKAPAHVVNRPGFHGASVV